LDDDFASIVHAVRLGRRIFDNLQKAMSYLLAVHVPIAGMSLIPLVLGWPLMFSPVHIVFLEFIIDPASSLVFEAEGEEQNVMSRPPRSPAEPLFRRRALIFLFLQGAVVLFVVLGVYGVALYNGLGENHARALAFTTLVIGNLAQILTNRSQVDTLWVTLKKPNIALWSVVGGTLAFLGLILYIPWLRNLFQFGPVDFAEFLIAMIAGMASVAWLELYKLLKGRLKSV
jgi:Ca2+-transporting ATPase